MIEMQPDNENVSNFFFGDSSHLHPLSRLSASEYRILAVPCHPGPKIGCHRSGLVAQVPCGAKKPNIDNVQTLDLKESQFLAVCDENLYQKVSVETRREMVEKRVV